MCIHYVQCSLCVSLYVHLYCLNFDLIFLHLVYVVGLISCCCNTGMSPFGINKASIYVYYLHCLCFDLAFRIVFRYFYILLYVSDTLLM